MKRLLLLAVFLTVGMSLLVWVAGGIEGSGHTRTEPTVARAAPEETPEGGLAPAKDFPGRLHEFEGGAFIPAPPEPYRYTDPRTGESVLVPDYIRWLLKIENGAPTESRQAGRQAFGMNGVRLVTWRKPRTVDEARSLALGTEGVRDPMRKWVVQAPHALADGLGLAALEGNAEDTNTVIELDGGVHLFDVERETTIDCESLLMWPQEDRARSTDRVVVRHETFELTGEGIELRREGDKTTITILRNALLKLHGNVPAADGKPVLDIGDREMVPGHISSEGTAVIVHRAASDGIGEHLSIELTQRVHAEREGNRTLDAERVRVEAFTVRRPARLEEPAAADRRRWRADTFEADGGVFIEYPGLTDGGDPYLLSASARYMLHKIAPDGSATTLLEGNPEFTLRGKIPLEGLERKGGPGFLRASAREQAWLEPAPAADVPPGADRSRYRRVRLRGNARLESRDAGVDPVQDTLEGEQMTLLLKEVDEVVPNADPTAAGRTRRRIVAVSFAALRDVRLGGTRMSGMTHHLHAEQLDTPDPIMYAEGPGTSFAFHGIRRGERLLGGGPREEAAGGSSARAPGAAPDSAPGAEPKDEWLLENLLARDSVVVETSVGGAALGLPTRLEAEELTYDRVSDRARAIASPGSVVQLSVGAAGGEHHHVTSRTMRLDRARGEVVAEGTVRGTVYLQGARSPRRPGEGLALREPRVGDASTLGVATNGRITIQSRLTAGRRIEPRLGAEQVLTIEGELVAELTAATLEVDSLRAQYLQVGLVRTLQAPSTTTTAPSVRVGGTRASGPFDGEAGEPAAAPPASRWDLESRTLRARFGPTGFETLEAAGAVRLVGDEGEVRGARFTYDATNRFLRVLGDRRERAWASFGPPKERNEVQARELNLRLGVHGPEELKAIVAPGQPVAATLIRRDAETPGALERFLVLCGADAVMTPTTFTAEGATVEIRRRFRPAPGEPWEAPFRLWSDSLTVKGTNLLSEQAADVRTVTAEGPRTTLHYGEGAETTTIWGRRFELNVPTSLATLEGGPDEGLRIHRGPPGRPAVKSEQDRVVVNLKTNTIHDWEGMRVILPGARNAR